jgi:hypothetical protein
MARKGIRPMKKTLMTVSRGRWGDEPISYTHLGINIIFIWLWLLPVIGVFFLLTRPFHYVGLAAETVWQKIRARRLSPRDEWNGETRNRPGSGAG